MATRRRFYQLELKTPNKIKKRCSSCRTKIHSSLYIDDEKEKNIYKRVLVYVRGDRRKTYHVTFKFYDVDPEKNEDLRTKECWVHCSCPFFKYNLEVVLSKSKNSSVIKSNGALPVVRNPDMVPYLCKHIYKAYPKAIKAPAEEIEKV